MDLETGRSKFYHAITNRFVFDDNVAKWGESNWDEDVWADEDEYLSKAQIEKYDEHIIKHTQHISEKRERPIKWKYFQYLESLFTEIYLDKYFTDKNELLKIG